MGRSATRLECVKWASLFSPAASASTTARIASGSSTSTCPVEIDGVVFAPGDLVFADEDGVVVVPTQAEGAVIQRAWAKVHAENEVRDAIKAGMKATEAFERYGVL